MEFLATVGEKFDRIWITPFRGKLLGIHGDVERIRARNSCRSFTGLALVYFIVGCICRVFGFGADHTERCFTSCFATLVISQSVRTSICRPFVRCLLFSSIGFIVYRIPEFWQSQALVEMICMHLNSSLAVVTTSAYLLHPWETACYIIVIFCITSSFPLFGILTVSISKELVLTLVPSCATILGLMILQRSTEASMRQMALDLRLARDQALEASRLKSQFVATMSHEIRTPLNGILGLLEPLLLTRLQDEQREWVKSIETSGRVLLSLANQILDFSRIEAGRLELECEEFDIRKTVEDVVQVCGITAKPDVDMLSSVSASVPPILCGDATRVQQILVNLLGNASKFTTSGEIVLRVTVTELEEAPLPAHHQGESSERPITDNLDTLSTSSQISMSGEDVSEKDGEPKFSQTAAEEEEEGVSYVRLEMSVSDSGMGMSEEQMSRLFQPFSQADNSHTRKFGGVGLGLTISKRLAALMNGDITVTSQLGYGSTFVASVCLKTPSVRDIPRRSSNVVNQLQLVGRNIILLSARQLSLDLYASQIRSAGANVIPELMLPDDNRHDCPAAILETLATTLRLSMVVVVIDRDEMNDQRWDAVEQAVKERFLPHVVIARQYTVPSIVHPSRVMVHKPVRQRRLIDAISTAQMPGSTPHVTSPPVPLSEGFARTGGTIVSVTGGDMLRTASYGHVSHMAQPTGALFTGSLMSFGPGADMVASGNNSMTNTPTTSRHGSPSNRARALSNASKPSNTDSPLSLRAVARPPLAKGQIPVRVLVAEDYAVNQMVIRVMLNGLHYYSEIVDNGRLAVEAFTSPDARYDIILMDLQMPEMDGFAATKAIREWETAHPGRHIPIIAVTASGMKEEKAACITAGMDDYIVKPINSAELQKKIQHFLSV